ncbi:UNKNOWN [Stylonychia lemnae]|uniref:Regulator of chromosome condensation 1/beta-lactamase-inhibitor protein II n=1 Tax=Stylonychia lemnae TaxID=5949 RepID=A0A078AT20_STYLE|nr:UNKNOWN [Stylonychia lemnae]|eukprot:CDW85605.1 UNKNOWN [Stylonychia lemnae]
MRYQLCTAKTNSIWSFGANGNLLNGLNMNYFRKNVYESPIQLNIETGDDEGELKCYIVDMISQQDYCLFLTEEGKVYSMGSSELGLLGLAFQVQFPNQDKIVQIKSGKSHALALSNEGRVFGWGLNNYGQVGYLNPEDLVKQQESEPAMQSKFSRQAIIFEPKQVYPTVEMLKDNDLANFYDEAIQIEVFEDSSYLVTEEGELFSWGKNENGMLGREAKLDVKMMTANDKKKKLTFSTFVPGRVTKLEKYRVRRISISEGKFMAYFATIQEDFEDEEKKDSSVDSDEEKDVVDDIVGGPKASVHKTGANSQKYHSTGSSKDVNSHENNMGGTQELRKQNTTKSNMSSNSSKLHTTSRAGWQGGRKAKQEKDQFKYMIEIIKKAQAIKEELSKFDRALADSVKPLTDLQDRNIYYQVIDKFSLGQEKMNDADELRQAIDRMQVQLKKNINVLEKLEKRNEQLQELINARANQFKGVDDEIFKDFSIFVELLNESLVMKKFNLVGCKMKVYQERMKEINFLEMIQQFRENDQIDIDKCGNHLHTCKKLCKKIQESLKKNTEFYLQMHMNCSIPSSLALSALTNSVYQQCDIWNGLNTLSSYTYILQSKIQDAEYTNDKVRLLWQYFSQLQKTDFNKKVEIHKKKIKDYPTTKEWYDALMKEINQEIKNIQQNVKFLMKENKGENDILHYCQSLLYDACLVRQLQYASQSALFNGATSTQSHTPGGVTLGNDQVNMLQREETLQKHQRDFLDSNRNNPSQKQTDPGAGNTSGFGDKIGSLFGGFFTKK